MNRIFLTLALLVSVTLLHAAPDVMKGRSLFNQNCASCHNGDMKSKSTGPALYGSEERWGAYPKADLYSWIRNSQALVKAGHPRAVEVFGEYKSVMTSFPALTDEDIESLLAYIKAKVEDPGKFAPAGATAATAAAAAPAKSSGLSTPILVVLFAVLGVLSLALINITNILNRLAREKAGLDPGPKVSLLSMLKSRQVVTFVLFAAVVFTGYNMVSGAIALGRQQGYAPEQPIKFSHKLHAGQHKIDCQYCHDGARRSKHAHIPGTSTCMNCHAAVKKGPQYGTEEIGKIYDYAGFNPSTDKYEKEGRPIEWVRIHNLPDHAYFNHAQHVVAGGIQCQTCHGPVQEMELVKQWSPLSMGWCVNCHRESKVKFADNNFYKDYERYHEELKSKKRDAVTVEDIGGLECQKCHY